MNSSNEFSSLFSNLYAHLFKNTNINSSNYFSTLSNNGNQKNSLNLLNFYENSYFWYLKRFYLLNNLSTNFIKSNLTFNNHKNPNSLFFTNLKDSNFLNYSLSLSYLLKSSYMNLNNYSHFNNNSFYLDEFYLNTTNNVDELKDLFLSNNNNEIFTKDNLNIFY